MPPRWPREPDRRDPAFRKLEDRINFAVHVALFAAVNSGSWFFRVLKDASWPWTLWMTGSWAAILVMHGLYIFGFADYSGSDSDSKPNKPEQT
jgi:integral membrane sensor domain MASE1